VSLALDDTNYLAAIEGEPKPLLGPQKVEWKHTSSGLFPVLDFAIENWQGDLEYAEVDVEQCPLMTRNYQVKGTPHLIWFHKGVPLGSRAGTMSPDFLNAFFVEMGKKSV
jgi:thioredoxin-like negative regulator of GroEL